MTEFLYALAVWLGLAFLVGSVLMGLRLLLGKLWPSGLLPPQRHYAAPWSFLEIAFVIVLCMYVLPGVFGVTLHTLAQSAGLVPPVDSKTADDGKSLIPFVLWAMALGFIPAVWLGLAFVRLISETQPYQVGLRTDRLLPDIVTGFLTWLVVAPLVILAYVLLVSLLKSLGGKPDMHEFVELVERNRSPWVLAGMIMTAVLWAPVVEEFLFRGLILKWTIDRRWGADMIVGLAFAWSPLIAASKGFSDAKMLAVLTPSFFVLATLPGYIFAESIAWPWLKEPNVARAIYAQALFFAIVHDAWPSQIALFLLALGLGWLAYRTQSLIGPITFHALFNTIASVGLIIEATHPPQDEKGKTQTTALTRPAPVSTATAVPGSWEPRRK